MKLVFVLTAAIFAAYISGAAAQGTVPDLRGPVYFDWLRSSPSVEARHIRQQITVGSSALASERIQAGKDGILQDVKQLQKPLPPPERNAASIYQALAKTLKEHPLNLPKYAEKGMGTTAIYSAEQVAAVRKILLARQDVMTLIHQAADRPECVYARDWSQGMGLTFPELLMMRRYVHLLKTESYLLAHEGRFLEAIANEARGFHIAQQAASDSMLLAYLVGVSCESVTLSGMQDIEQIAGPNVATSMFVSSTVLTVQPRPSFRAAMAGETCLVCTQFSVMHQADHYGMAGLKALIASNDLSVTAVKNLHTTPRTEQKLTHDLIDAWEANLLHQMRLLVLASDQPVQIRRTVFAKVSQQKEPGDLFDLTALISDILLPVYGPTDEDDTRIEAREMITLAAAYVLGDKARAGIYPTALPARFTDPFTDKPMGYQREGANGFVVYSVGPDGTFDGGKAGVKTPPGQAAFRYPVTNRGALK